MVRSRAWAVAAVLSMILVASAARAQTPSDPWSKGANWLSLRFGYAGSTVKNAPDGGVGVGIGYTRFFGPKWSMSGFAQLDLLGRYGGASEIVAPWTVEVTRRFKMSPELRPYLGVGAGFVWHHVYRTGSDTSDLRPAFVVAVGADTPIQSNLMIGFDTRVWVETGAESTDPVFPNEESSAIRVAAKINLAYVY